MIMLIGRYPYVFAEATHGSHSGRSRMGRKVHKAEVERRVRQHRISGGMDGDWMNTWEPQEVLTNAQVAINECLRDRSACNSVPKQCHTVHDGA